MRSNSFERRALARRSLRKSRKLHWGGFDCLEAREVPATVAPYDIGTPAWTEIWVDPVGGDDNRTGASRSLALRTLNAAMARVPAGTELATTGFRIMLTPGTYQRTQVPIWIENRWGTRNCPIMIQAADGPGTVVLPNMDLFGCRYFYMDGLTIRDAADPLHFASSRNVLMRNLTIEGLGTGYGRPKETLKVNQSQYVYLENCTISGAWDNAVDYVGVQYGHVIDSRISGAEDWAMYAKGGSAYLTISDNVFSDSGTGGFTAGQGTGYEFMTSPWLHYEAYDIKFVNNIVRDTWGAGVGVNGGYNVLIAGNTFYRVGSRSHAMEFVFGGRTVDGDTAQAVIHQQAGGWGPTQVGWDYGQPIPNKHVYVYNNILYNPAGFRSQWQHFQVDGPRTPSAGSNIPSPALADDDVRVAGNIIWNGPADLPLGVGDGGGGAPSNPTMNETQLRRDNAINTVEPQFVNAAAGDFRPVAGGSIYQFQALTVPNFQWADAPTRPAVPAGNPSNALTIDRAGAARTATSPPGAYVGSGGAVVTAADLAIAMMAPASTTAGQSFAMSIDVSNIGPAASASVVTLNLPAGVSFVSGSVTGGSVAASGGVVTAQVPSITAGGTSRVTVNVVSSTAATYTLQASVAGAVSDPVAANNSASRSVVVNPVASTTPLPASSLRLTPGTGQIRLDWTLPANSVPAISGVRVVRRTDRMPTGPNDGTLVFQGLGSTFTNTGLTAGQTYFYRVDTYSATTNTTRVYNNTALAPIGQAVPLAAATAPIVITNAVDNVLTSVQNTSANLGGLDTLQFYREPDRLYRPMIKFDLAQIPAGRVIDSARVSLFRQAGLYSNQPMTVTVRALSRAWQEGNGTSHSAPGSGSSWLRSADGVSWTTPGGDFVSTYDFGNGPNGVVRTQTIPSFSTAGRIEFDVTNLVRAWSSGALANNGMAFVIESGNWTEYVFASSENATVSRRPQLIVATRAAESAPAGMAFKANGADESIIAAPTPAPPVSGILSHSGFGRRRPARNPLG